MFTSPDPRCESKNAVRGLRRHLLIDGSHGRAAFPPPTHGAGKAAVPLYPCCQRRPSTRRSARPLTHDSASIRTTPPPAARKTPLTSRPPPLSATPSPWDSTREIHRRLRGAATLGSTRVARMSPTTCFASALPYTHDAPSSRITRGAYSTSPSPPRRHRPAVAQHHSCAGA